MKIFKKKNWTRLLEFINLDDTIKAMKSPPIIINNLATETKEDRDLIQSLCVTVYDTTDVFDAVPTCHCRKTREMVNIGQICPHCGFPVVAHHSMDIQHDVWIRAPKLIGKLPSPLFWLFMQRYLRSVKFDGFRWAMDPKQPDPPISNKRDSRIVEKFKSVGYVRGLSHAQEQLDLLIQVAVSFCHNHTDKSDLIQFVSKYRSHLFVEHIPIPSKVAVAVEITPYAKIVDSIVSRLMEAIYTAAHTNMETNVRSLESRFTTVMTELSAYYTGVISKTLDGSNGFIRRVLYGTRMNFSFRGIISSMHGYHEYDTIMVPYSQLLVCLEPIVFRILIMDHGMTLSECMKYCNTHAKDYDPLLWGILERIINETPVPERPSTALTTVQRTKDGKVVLKKLASTLKTISRTGGGIMTCLTRYPSLVRTSSQGLRIVGITHNEIRLSVNVTTGPNADFDGDNMTGTIALDLASYYAFERLSPHYDIHSTSVIGEIKSNIKMPDVTVMNIYRWLEEETLIIDD